MIAVHRSIAAVTAVLAIASAGIAGSQTPTSGSLTIDSSRLAGLDSSGRLLIFARNPVQSGSSISHLDTTAFPSLLMEPGISSELTPLGTDVTVPALRDMGWSSGNSTFSINFLDNSGQGFNDATLGAQRRNALQQAANVFAGLIKSSVTINIDARFQSLSCSTTDGATLAQASPSFVFTVAGSAFPQSWYPGPLAEALTGQNLSLANNTDPNDGDLRVTFNNQIDNDCLGPGRSFFYGTGEEASGQTHFINVALHEIAHGLGFLTFINASTGQQFNARPDVYSHFLRDTVFRKSWADLSPTQIRTSAVRSGRLIWTGSKANQLARTLLDPLPVFTIQPPSAIAGTFEAGLAQFGPRVADTMPVAELVLARDDSSSPSLLCGPVKNRSAVNRRIAVVDRGDCTFVSKVLSAQDAGAVGVLVINNVSGIVTMGGDDPAVQIPSLSVSPADGALIREAIMNPQDVEDPDDGGGGGGDGGGGNPPPPVTTEGVDGPTGVPSTCIENDTTVCLLENRFKVELKFSTVDQTDTPATALRLTTDTGYFWFFLESNVEVVLKVIDGCAVNDRFWVFAGGLTDVELTLTVTDTASGASRIYASSGGALLPIQDTSAFDLCN